jgi:hypothetical protein
MDTLQLNTKQLRIKKFTDKVQNKGREERIRYLQNRINELKIKIRNYTNKIEMFTQKSETEDLSKSEILELAKNEKELAKCRELHLKLSNEYNFLFDTYTSEWWKKRTEKKGTNKQKNLNLRLHVNLY